MLVLKLLRLGIQLASSTVKLLLWRLFQNQSFLNTSFKLRYFPHLYTISFITGFVIKKVGMKFHCEKCLDRLQANETDGVDHNLLIKRKAYGKLIYPSRDSIKIIKSCEKILKVFQLKFDIFSTGVYIVDTNLKFSFLIIGHI